MHFSSHKALIKAAREHAVAIETGQQRAGLRHKHTEKQDLDVKLLQCIRQPSHI